MIEFKCDCGQKYRLAPDFAGKKIRCKKCALVLRVPTPESAEAPNPPEAADLLMARTENGAYEMQEDAADPGFDPLAALATSEPAPSQAQRPSAKGARSAAPATGTKAEGELGKLVKEFPRLPAWEAIVSTYGGAAGMFANCFICYLVAPLLILGGLVALLENNQVKTVIPIYKDPTWGPVFALVAVVWWSIPTALMVMIAKMPLLKVYEHGFQLRSVGGGTKTMLFDEVEELTIGSPMSGMTRLSVNVSKAGLSPVQRGTAAMVEVTHKSALNVKLRNGKVRTFKGLGSAFNMRDFQAFVQMIRTRLAKAGRPGAEAP